MLRNKIHALLDRQRDLELPQCSDIFGVRGLGFLRRLKLSEPDATLLQEQLALHDLIAQQMKAQEKRIAGEFASEAMHPRLMSVPGVGATLAALSGNLRLHDKREKRVKYWEIIADNLSKAGFSLGWVSVLDVQGRTIWIVDAHGYGKRFIVRAEEILTAFVELQRAIHEFAVSLML
jgi:hypothetical protein